MQRVEPKKERAKTLLTPFGRLQNEFILWPIDSACKEYATKCVLCVCLFEICVCVVGNIYMVYLVAYIVHFIQIFLALNANISGSLQLHVWSGL